MASAPTDNNSRRDRSLFLCALSLFAGVVYYVLFRGQTLPQPLSWIPGVAAGQVPTDLSFGGFPSLVHAFATTQMLLWLPGINRKREPALVCIAAIALLAMELTFGTLDLLDVIAIATGTIVAWRISRPAMLPGESRNSPRLTSAAPHTRRYIMPAAVLSISSLMAMGSTMLEDPGCALYDEAGNCVEQKHWGKPIYMSFQQLRESVAVEAPRAFNRIGQLYLYGSYLFISESNQGIHVIDNSEPAYPKMLAFIRIPGNTELSIRGNYLYADSYVDMVTLDLNDPAHVTLVDRQLDIFPYDLFQNIPYNIAFRTADLDQSNGVVVSYE